MKWEVETSQYVAAYENQVFEVEADTEDEARALVEDGQGVRLAEAYTIEVDRDLAELSINYINVIE